MSKQGKGADTPIRDMGLAEFMAQFPDEESARDYLIKRRWGDGMYCPHCENTDASRIITNDKPPLPHHCRGCKRYFSIRTGTVMAASKISLRKWLLAIYLITVHHEGISSLALARELGITQKSAWYLGHRIRAAFEDQGGLSADSVESGTYRSMSEAHLQRYANEFAVRHRMVGQSTMSKVESVLEGMIGKRLTYRQLIR